MARLYSQKVVSQLSQASPAAKQEFAKEILRGKSKIFKVRLIF